MIKGDTRSLDYSSDRVCQVLLIQGKVDPELLTNKLAFGRSRLQCADPLT